MAWINPPTHFKIVFECLDFFYLCNIPKAIPTLYSDQEETDYRVVLFIYLFIYSTLITRGSTYKIEHARALKRPY